MRVAPIIPALAMLAGCNLFDDSDPREGLEDIDACIKRVSAEYHEGVVDLLQSEERRRPTYTFDITKLSFDDIKDLTVPDEGGEAGSVQMSGFKAPPYRKRMFLEMNVDEKGAFFLGADPAYYRVQGEPIALQDVFADGCKKQRPGMRLLSFTFENPPTSGTGSGDTNPETESD